MTHSPSPDATPDSAPPRVDPAADDNRATLQAYEGDARRYAAATAPSAATDNEALQRLAAALHPGARVLELASGPGWDADTLETLGLDVRRTDAAAAFCEFQAERGKRVEPLDLLVDPFGGPYDGVVALYVLQHVHRDRTAGVLDRVAAALVDGGMCLVSLREGAGELWERSERSGAYHVVLRGRDEFDAALRAAGLTVVWRKHHADADGAWMTLLAGKAS